MSDQPTKRTFWSKVQGNFWSACLIIGYLLSRVFLWALFTVFALPIISFSFLFFGTQGAAVSMRSLAEIFKNHNL